MGHHLGVRITALRTWMAHAVNQSVGAARRVGKAMAKRVRAATGRIEAGVGVGEDESRFGGNRARVWFEEVMEETRAKLLQILEKSFFERFPKLERALRRFLGQPTKEVAPKLPPPKRPTGPLGAHGPVRSAEAERFRAQIERGILKAHTTERAGLQETMRRKREQSDPGGGQDPDQT
ncbi:MAG: hypothetical protein KC933_36030 [Myxococcales bacterium]|nr:hypothetical protein [Myxococcales bacterium]